MSEEALCLSCPHNLCIRRVPVFSTLDEEALHELAPLIRHEDFDKGDRILTEGDETDAIHILNEGSVKAYRISPDGREQILYVFSEGDFFGESFLLQRQPATYSVDALEPVKLCLLDRPCFTQLLRAHPDISIQIISELGRRIVRMENTFQSMGIRNVDARIAALLLDYIDMYGRSDREGVLVDLPLSREGMANQLGIARETMSRKISGLEAAGVLVSLSHRTVRILDLPALETMAGTPGI